MTREEINERANRNNNALHCLRVMVGEEVCEECELYGTTGTDHCEADCVRVAIEALKKEPRKGKWYRQTNDYVDYYECSECGMAMGIYDVKNYCPNCGSRNEVEE